MSVRYLTPTTILIQSEIKFFGLNRGASDGTSLGITFEVAPEAAADQRGFRLCIFEEKKRLDLMSLHMEYMKGSCTKDEYEDRKRVLTANYDSAIAALQPKDDNGTGNG